MFCIQNFIFLQLHYTLGGLLDPIQNFQKKISIALALEQEGLMATPAKRPRLNLQLDKDYHIVVSVEQHQIGPCDCKRDWFILGLIFLFIGSLLYYMIWFYFYVAQQIKQQ